MVVTVVVVGVEASPSLFTLPLVFFFMGTVQVVVAKGRQLLLPHSLHSLSLSVCLSVFVLNIIAAYVVPHSPSFLPSFLVSSLLFSFLLLF